MDPEDIAESATSVATDAQSSATSSSGGTGHRSRKEKLVIRSFSTEVDEGMEPKILSHEEYFGASPNAKRGSRNRRTASAPVVGAKISRESSPSLEDSLECGVPGDVEVDVVIDLRQHVDMKASSSTPRKYRKRKFCDDGNGDNMEIEGGLEIPAKKRKMGRPRTYTKKNTNPKRRLEWGAADKKSRKSLLHQQNAKFMRRNLSPNKKGNKVRLATTRGVTFTEPIIITKSPEVARKVVTPGTSGSRPSSPAECSKSSTTPLTTPLTTPPRRLVKYKVHEKFARTIGRRCEITDEATSSTTDEKLVQAKQEEKNATVVAAAAAAEEQFLPALPPPPPPPSSPKYQSVPPPPPPVEADDEKEEEIYNDIEEYNSGLSSLQRLLRCGDNQVEDPGSKVLSVTLADVCKEAVAKLAKLVRKRGRVETDSEEELGDHDLDSLTTSSPTDDHNNSDYDSDSDSVELRFSTSHLFNFARSLINNSQKTKELKLLAELNENKELPPKKYFFDAFYQKKNGQQHYPKLTEEELQVFKELLEQDENFECYDDEQEAANLYCELVRSELKAMKTAQAKGHEAAALLNEEGTTPGKKKVVATMIPISFKDGENEHGLYLSKDELVERIMKGKENQLKELKTRRLRNGKEVPLKRIRIPQLKRRKSRDYLGSREKRRKSWVPASTVPAAAAAITNLHISTGLISNGDGDGAGMRLRQGKTISALEIDSSANFKIQIPGSLDGSVAGGGEDVLAPVGSKPDEYTQRVEANLRRLEAGGVVELDMDAGAGGESSPKKSLVDPSTASTRCRTQPLSRLTAFSLPPPTSSSAAKSIADFNLFFGNANAHAPDASEMSPLGLPPVPLLSNSFTFKPIQPYPLTMAMVGGPFHDLDPFQSRTPPPTHASMRCSSPWAKWPGGSGALSPSKSRYSRQKHSNLCPPFDNNHCSYNNHHCANPRAPSSRFCIQHVDEGATVNFERCKYVKGSRECGLYIPRSNSQALFCDIHALKIANARVKKSVPPKPLDKTEGLLKHLRCNLDRTQGKIMEHGMGNYLVRKELLDNERETLNNASDSAESEEEVNADELYKAQKGDDDSDVDDCDFTSVGGNEPDYSCLRNAGYYTVDECVKMYRSALLQTKDKLHQEMELLKRKYAHGWNSYCQKVRALKNQRVSFTTDPKFLSTTKTDLTEEQVQHEIKVHNATQAMLSHRRNKGARALLRQQVLVKRQDLFEALRSSSSTTSTSGNSGTNSTTFPEYSSQPLHPNETKEEIKLRLKRQRKGRPLLCAFGKLGDKCYSSVLPLSRFCLQHIIHDKTQKLYIPCNFRLGPDADDVCKTPVWSEISKFGCALHALPIPLKEPPESQNKKPKLEEEIDKLMEDPEMDSSGSEGDGEVQEEDMVREMEELVGDEVVDLDHFRESVTSLYTNGIIYLSDSEESEDTDEEEDTGEDQPLPPPPSKTAPVAYTMLYNTSSL